MSLLLLRLFLSLSRFLSTASLHLAVKAFILAERRVLFLALFLFLFQVSRQLFNELFLPLELFGG